MYNKTKHLCFGSTEMCLAIRQLGRQGKIEAESSFVLSAIRTHCWFHALPCSNSTLIKFAAQTWVVWIFTAIARVVFSISWGRWNGDPLQEPLQEDFARFGYRTERKVYMFWNPVMYWRYARTCSLWQFQPFFSLKCGESEALSLYPPPQNLCRSCIQKKKRWP